MSSNESPIGTQRRITGAMPGQPIAYRVMPPAQFLTVR
jgi:hypothetical protein